MAAQVRRGWLIAALVAAVAVLLGSMLVAATATARARSDSGSFSFLSGSPRAAPSLPGTVVNVSLTNMGGPMMGQRNAMHGGVMRVSTDRAAVPAGTVSFFATNYGGIDHELVIVSLEDSQNVGTHSIGRDGKIDEAGSLGEASNSDGEGAGKGIRPGTSGWVTLNLAPGRYELLCNLHGHYAAGMYALLTVS